MKRPIEWYEQMIVIRSDNAERTRADIEGAKKSLAKAEVHLDFLKMQVSMAKKEKKDGFDDERYKIKLRPV